MEGSGQNGEGPITGSGTFTTDGDTPTVGTTYSVTNATGSFSNATLGTFSVTGLKNPSNFQWSGALTNQLLVQLFEPNVLDLAGQDGGNARIGSNNSDTFIAASELAVIDSLDCDRTCFFDLTSTSLQPQGNAPASVPGPLPLMGAAAAFGWTRRLRRRVYLGD